MLATACFILLTKVFWGRLKEMRVTYVRNSQNGNRINIFFLLFRIQIFLNYILTSVIYIHWKWNLLFLKGEISKGKTPLNAEMFWQRLILFWMQILATWCLFEVVSDSVSILSNGYLISISTFYFRIIYRFASNFQQLVICIVEKRPYHETWWKDTWTRNVQKRKCSALSHLMDVTSK